MIREDGNPGPSEAETGPEQRRALFHVVRGTPSDEEVAALTVVLAAAVSAGAAASVEDSGRRQPVDRWSDPAARLRAPLHPGPGAWRASAGPR